MTTGQATGVLATRDLTVDDLDAAFDLRSRSFGLRLTDRAPQNPQT